MLKKVVLGLSVFVSAQASAVNLSVANNIQFLVVNGENVATSSWNPTRQVVLPAGKHQIAVRFDGEVREGNKDRLFTSRPYLLTVNLTQQDAMITLPSINSLSQAKAHFQRDPQWSLKQNSTVTLLPSVALEGQGVAAYRNVANLVESYNQKHGITMSEAPSNNSKSSTGTDMKKVETRLSLKAFYQQSTLEEQQAFKVWLASKS